MSTEELLAKIADHRTRRRDVAACYRAGIAPATCDRIDWKAVNGAILERWSLHALNWIKQEAWRTTEARRGQ